MAVIKLTKKNKLDQLVARLTLQTGRKPTQQDVLDAAVEIAEEHFNELQAKVSPHPLLDDEKITRILEMRKKLAKISWQEERRKDFANDDDADIYSH